MDAWLAVADNRGEFERLCRALELEAGFSLSLVDVPDVVTERRVIELLARRDQRLELLDARANGDQAPVRELLRRRASVFFVLRSVEASRSDVEALERCLAQLNVRRDQLVARGHVLVIVLRRDAVARMLDVAPDLYSVHRARFRFARLVEPRPDPLWLIEDHEYAAVLDDDGRPFEDRLARYKWTHLGPNPNPNPEEPIADRIFARRENVRSIAPLASDDLAHALAAPSLADARVLRNGLVAAQAATCPYLTNLCALALTWLHLQRSELTEAHGVLASVPSPHHASVQLPALVSAAIHVLVRRELLRLHLAAAEGINPRVSLLSSDSPVMQVINLFDKAAWSGALGVAEIAWEYGDLDFAAKHLQLALRKIEAWHGNWQFDPMLRALPTDLIEATVPERDRADAHFWLRSTYKFLSQEWAQTWTNFLMIERTLGPGERIEELVELAFAWLAVTTKHSIYGVWRPLIDIHVETGDAAALNRLIALLFDDEASRFGPRHSAALHVIADHVYHGRLQLSDTNRATLAQRASRAADSALEMHLGWWAMRIALGMA